MIGIFFECADPYEAIEILAYILLIPDAYKFVISIFIFTVIQKLDSLVIDLFRRIRTSAGSQKQGERQQ